MDAQMAVKDRIKEARKAAGFTQPELSNECGWGYSQSRISNYERGEREPSTSSVKKIADATGKPFEWFYMEGSAQVSEPMALYEIGTRGLETVPVVGNTQAGPDAQWLEEDYPPGYGESYLDAPCRDPNAYALRVRGQSMQPRMREGEVVLVSPNTDPAPGDEVVVLCKNGEVMVKELVYWRGGEIALDSINHEHSRIVKSESDIEFMHTVLGVFRPSSIKHR